MPLPIVDSAEPAQPKKVPALTGGNRRVHLHTFGCQMNAHDSLRMAEQLSHSGFAVTETPDDADLIVVNTCSVREHAVQKALSEIGRLKAQKRARNAKIAVTGCVAQQEGDKLLKRYPDIDLVLGPDNIYQINGLVERVFEGERLALAELDETPGFQFLSSAPAGAWGQSPQIGLRAQRVSAFITVQKGCDKKCSYCIVPRVRGAEVSRPLEEIVREVELLVSEGVREVTLLGQNIDAYRDPENRRFDALLRAVGEVPGLWRLRFTTSHPNDFSEAMASAMASVPTICEHLHLPAQSGSDAVLKRMYRGYSKMRYLEKIAMVRAKIPELRLTTDLIVGFPGESEDDFKETLSLVGEAGFDAAFVFAYSVRPGTPAEPWAETVSEAEKSERLRRLNEVVRQQALARAQRFVGRTEEVLVEGPSRTNASVLTGRNRQNYPVNFSVTNFTGTIEPGSLVSVAITAADGGFSLTGASIGRTL